MSERHPSESGSPEPLGPQHFPSPFTKRRDHPSTTRTTTTTTTDELLDDDPAPFCSTSLAPTLPRSLSLSPLVPSRYLPTRLQSLILPLPYLEPTTYTITRSLSNGSLSRFTLLAPLLSPFLSSHLSPSDSTASFLPVLFSATICNRIYLSLSLSLPSLFLFLS